MALKKCKECGKEMSSKAASCPSCGVVLRKKTGCLTYVVAVFFGIIALGVISSLLVDPSGVPSTKPEAGLKLPNIGKQIVTFEEYQKIQDEASYREVVQIIGAEGEEMSRNKMKAVPGVMDSVETVMYQWVNGNGSNMNAMFQGDKLVQKAQVGLK